MTVITVQPYEKVHTPSVMEMYEMTVERAKKLFLDGWVVTLGLSGKDSGAASVCLVEGLRQAVEINANVGPLYVVTTDTTLDNMVLHSYMLDLHDDLTQYGEDNGLPIYTQELKPSLLNQPMVEYIGRGKLLRTPQTSVNGRDCAVDWKIKPVERFLKSISKKHQTTKVVSVSGSRDEESAVRAANLKKRGESATEIVKTDLGFSNPIIKDWSLENVWGLFNLVYDDEIETYSDRLHLMRRHYAAGNSGTCDLFAGKNSSSNKACGARFGCALCAMNTRDKSLEAQIETDPKTYGFMKPLNDLRTYMINTLWDYDNRSKIGREMKDNFVKVGVNQYSIEYRANLLRYVLSFQQRLYLEHGYHPISLIDTDQILAIQYQWSREGGESEPGLALKIYNEICNNWEEEVFYPIPETTFCEQPKKSGKMTYTHFELGKFVHDYHYMGDTMGLDDETLDGEFSHRARQYRKNGETRRVMAFEEAQSFEINHEGGRAMNFVMSFYPSLVEDGHLEGKCPTVMLKHLLESGVIRISKGTIARLDEDAKRSQALHALSINLQVPIDDVVTHFSISDEHKQMIIEQQRERRLNTVQASLF